MNPSVVVSMKIKRGCTSKKKEVNSCNLTHSSIVTAVQLFDEYLVTIQFCGQFAGNFM